MCIRDRRCFVRFVHDQGLTAKREIRVETMAGLIVPRLEDDGKVSVDMGVPVFAPAQIPFVAATDDLVQALLVGDEEIAVTAVGKMCIRDSPCDGLARWPR